LSGHIHGPIFVNGALAYWRFALVDLAVDWLSRRGLTGALPDEFPGIFQRPCPPSQGQTTQSLVVVPSTIHFD
jgi:hypothetical protein